MHGNIVKFRERLFYGIIIMGLSVIGIPFIPFVPVAMLIGCWKIDNNTHGSGAIGEVMASWLITAIIGAATYFLIVLWGINALIQ